MEVAIRYPLWENRGCNQIPLTDNQMGIIGRICGLTLIQEKYTDTIMAVIPVKARVHFPQAWQSGKETSEVFILRVALSDRLG